jgi:hypothetical protein
MTRSSFSGTDIKKIVIEASLGVDRKQRNEFMLSMRKNYEFRHPSIYFIED